MAEVTVGEATRLSGYSAEYIRRLLRAGRVKGRRASNNTADGWEVDEASLTLYTDMMLADGRGQCGPRS